MQTPPSFFASSSAAADFDWRAAGLRYFSYNFFLRRKFGFRVQRVSVDAGFTCPNVDGTVATGGCAFCDNRSFSPSRRLPRLSVREQIDEGIRRLQGRYDCEHFMAYFQPATNTYAPADRLRPPTSTGGRLDCAISRTTSSSAASSGSASSGSASMPALPVPTWMGRLPRAAVRSVTTAASAPAAA